MVDELTQESFQTGKAIVTFSVDLITHPSHCGSL